MSLNLCECGGEVDIRFGGHDANFYAECRECGKTVDLEAVDMPGAVQEWNNRKGKPTKNYIPEIAKMLGVEIGEEFEIVGFGDDKFFFGKETLYLKRTKPRECDGLIGRLLTGRVIINKLPFVPSLGDKYFYVYQCGRKLEVGCAIWIDELLDYQRKHCGNVFRTFAIAESKRFALFTDVAEKPWEGIID